MVVVVSFTGADGASTTISFAGDAVAVYGGSSWDHGNYTVFLDGVPQLELNGGSNGLASSFHPQVLILFLFNWLSTH